MRKLSVLLFGLCLGACTLNSNHEQTEDAAAGGSKRGDAPPPNLQIGRPSVAPFTVVSVMSLREPWAMAFLPDSGQRLLVTEKSGQLLLIDPDVGDAVKVAGVPRVDYGGQGGLGDVIAHPQYASNHIIYLSYAEAGKRDTRGAAVARAVLDVDARVPTLRNVEVIWRQVPKVTGRGHYGHRLLFDDAGYLFISSGDRQKFDPAQDMTQNLGKILRLNDDGSIPEDNPFYNLGGVSAEIWTLGHRNPLGLAFDAKGQLWNHEMGPAGGDELNLVERANNYGYPIVSNGRHYDGRSIPDHPTHPEFVPPRAWWTPVISPGGLLFYDGDKFPEWQGDALIAGLSSQALIRVQINGADAREVARYPMNRRMRAVAQDSEGYVWMLEDNGRLLRLVPSTESSD